MLCWKDPFIMLLNGLRIGKKKEFKVNFSEIFRDFVRNLIFPSLSSLNPLRSVSPEPPFLYQRGENKDKNRVSVVVFLFDPSKLFPQKILNPPEIGWLCR